MLQIHLCVTRMIQEQKNRSTCAPWQDPDHNFWLKQTPNSQLHPSPHAPHSGISAGALALPPSSMSDLSLLLLIHHSLNRCGEGCQSREQTHTASTPLQSHLILECRA